MKFWVEFKELLLVLTVRSSLFDSWKREDKDAYYERNRSQIRMLLGGIFAIIYMSIRYAIPLRGSAYRNLLNSMDEMYQEYIKLVHIKQGPSHKIFDTEYEEPKGPFADYINTLGDIDKL